jgi:hypothetical protein
MSFAGDDPVGQARKREECSASPIKSDRFMHDFEGNCEIVEDHSRIRGINAAFERSRMCTMLDYHSRLQLDHAQKLEARVLNLAVSGDTTNHLQWCSLIMTLSVAALHYSDAFLSLDGPQPQEHQERCQRLSVETTEEIHGNYRTLWHMGLLGLKKKPDWSMQEFDEALRLIAPIRDFVTMHFRLRSLVPELSNFSSGNQFTA